MAEEPDPTAVGVTVGDYSPSWTLASSCYGTTPKALRAFLIPSMGHGHWDVRTVSEGDWEQELAPVKH